MSANRPEPVPGGSGCAEQDLTAGLSADVGRRSGNGRNPVGGALYAGPMSCLVCDLGAWTVFASRAPLSPVPKEEADIALSEADCSEAGASRARRSPCLSSMTAFSRIHAGIPPRLPVPLHLATPSDRHRGRSRLLVGHRLPRLLPDNPLLLFDDVDGPLYTVSPALYLLMRAPLADDVNLALAATVLCGTYVRRPDENGEICYREDPLATVGGLLADLEPCGGRRGHRRLKDLLPFCQERSASPMETALSLLMTAPKSLGGRGFPRALLNSKWVLTPDERFALDGQSTMRVDFLWPEAGFGIEYDSAKFHDSPEQQEKDAARREVAEGRGIHLMTVTRATVRDELKLDLLLEKAAGRLGVGFDWNDRMLAASRALRARVLCEHLFW